MSMEGIMNRGPVVVEKDGHDGYGQWQGAWIFALVIIFLAVLFIAFRHNRNEGGYENLLPLAMLGHKKHGCDLDDWKMTEMIKDQAMDTGKIIHDVDTQTAQLQRSMDAQNCLVRDKIGEVLANQNKCAWESERLYNQRYIDEMRDKMAELRLMVSEKDNRFLHRQTMNELAAIKCGMVKEPRFLPSGGYPAMERCA